MTAFSPQEVERVAKVVVELATPARWKAEHFWMHRRRRSFGIVLALCPTTFALGGEVFGSPDTARGVAAFIGPFWIGVATLAVRQHLIGTGEGGRDGR